MATYIDIETKYKGIELKIESRKAGYGNAFGRSECSEACSLKIESRKAGYGNNIFNGRFI